MNNAPLKIPIRSENKTFVNISAISMAINGGTTLNIAGITRTDFGVFILFR